MNSNTHIPLIISDGNGSNASDSTSLSASLKLNADALARLTRLLLILLASCSLFVAQAQAQSASRRRSQPASGAGKNAGPRAAAYSCPMHPEVVSKSPGRCPKCGMDLKPVSTTKNRAAASPSAAAASESPSAATVAEHERGPLRIPDIAVTDQNGRRLNFYSDLIKGRTVAINFIFTTCKTVCPPLTATFRRVQQGLGERAGREVQMISISVDPTTDVPERLKEFAAKFNAGPGWTFLTGEKTEIDKLLKALGASVPDDKNNHTSMILVGNAATGYWTRTYGLAPAATILKVIDEAAATKARNEVAAPSPTQSAAAPASAEPETTQADRQKQLARAASKYFPNLVLINQDNQPLHFYDDLLKGKTVMINFMLTHCTGACSPMTANLAKVQKYLGERVGREVWMLSISVDPEHDTPEALRKYAEGFKVQPGWYFLTGTKENVKGVLSKLGGYTDDPQQHSTVLIIGDEATGQWMKVPALARPSDIADAVTKILSTKKGE